MGELEVIQHPQINGLRMFFDTLDYRTPHFHREFELIWILDGGMEVRGEQISLQAAADDMLLFSPNQIHEFRRMGDRCTFLCIQIAPELLTRALPTVSNIRFCDIGLKAHCSARQYHTMETTLLQMFRRYLEQTAGYELYCAGQIHLLFGELLALMPYRLMSSAELAEQERRSGRLQRLLEFVDENYMNKIRLSDFARLEGRSVSYLSHFISRAMQQSFQEYVNTVRFRSACKRIASGQKRMIDVCVESGYSDYRYFSRTFRQKVGMTPEEYSRQVKEIPVEEGALRSFHSQERFYTRAESREMLSEYEKKYSI